MSTGLSRDVTVVCRENRQNRFLKLGKSLNNIFVLKDNLNEDAGRNSNYDCQ